MSECWVTRYISFSVRDFSFALVMYISGVPCLRPNNVPFSVLLITRASQGASSSGLLLNARVCPISVTLAHSLPTFFFSLNTLTKLMATTKQSQSTPNLTLLCCLWIFPGWWWVEQDLSLSYLLVLLPPHPNSHKHVGQRARSLRVAFPLSLMGCVVCVWRCVELCVHHFYNLYF